MGSGRAIRVAHIELLDDKASASAIAFDSC
jgi:hypothetical protein